MHNPLNLAGFSSSVTPTNNTLVAKYTLTAPAGSTVSVEFGLDTTYGRSTWWVPAPSGGGTVSILVGGMYASSLYHMRALVNLNGVVTPDIDHTFQTGALPSGMPQTAVFASGTPSPGVELVNVNPSPVCVTDLKGDFIWYYLHPADLKYQGATMPVKPLANGNYMAMITNRYSRPAPPTPYGVFREFDLAGDTIREMDLAALNQKIQKMKTPFGRAIRADYYSHDFWNMANGDVVIIVQEKANVPGVTGAVWGDNLIVLDRTFNPVWVWSIFDVLDINRHPYLWNPDHDWTHCNAIQETPDGNFLLSVRNQSWVLKIDYAGGTGKVLWTLGYQGDFQLQSSNTDDWFYAQHFPHILTTSGSNITALTIMDNGNSRVPPVTPPYSRGIIMHIDETSNPKTAQVAWQWPSSPDMYSYWGGNVVRLPNGNMEICMSDPYGDQLPFSFAVEVDALSLSDVWYMYIGPADAYRCYRIPSLYPGVQW